ncbi:hypothetical protein BOO91_20300 [Vibrio navarrensis]|uniref:Uncharacterized protein n=1 Tax=Vibrio navarrensis TaxID=29495 RepID=A0AAJ4I8T1_9VIBR|nr:MULTISPECIES: hypothetical protein [Vibrio]KJR37981.1 hypothetical protein UF06_03650 [Vibrio sp. S234-5]MBE3663263.1 hypothetical protein [Vibrio navarrensis]MBE4605891.1 hypothetical protein [Vibrio navarrensis]QPL52217.1 hypothetical protein I3X05_08830 [Vibrio navarrensis]
MFILKHQDEDIKYTFSKGGFAIADGKLFLSLESKAVDEEAFPDCYLFAIDGFELSNGIESQIINISTNPNDEAPNIYVYTSFHACEVNAEINLKVLDSTHIEIEFNVISEDVNYYNEKAKPNPFIGSTKLTQKNKNELWLPV